MAQDYYVRMIKPGIPGDTAFQRLSDKGKILFLVMPCGCDDTGHIKYNELEFRSRFFPAEDLTASYINSLVEELIRERFTELYLYERERWLLMRTFRKHQHPEHPRHCSSPYSPRELESTELLKIKSVREGVLCGCSKNPECISARSAAEAMSGTRSNTRLTLKRFLQEHPEYTVRGQGYYSVDPLNGQCLDPDRSLSDCTGLGWTGLEKPLDGKSREDIHTGPNGDFDSAQYQPKTTAEDRRTQKGEVEEIAKDMLALLKVAANSKILNTLVRTLETRARSLGTSEREAGHRLLVKAQIRAMDGPPEDWEAWFSDQRYLYVPEGDPQLTNPRIEARPTCGGSKCADGWEPIKTATGAVSRRCEACVKLWEYA